jgi:hypothetical protein
MPDSLARVFQTKITTANKAMEHPGFQVVWAIIALGVGNPPPVQIVIIGKRTCQRYFVSARRAMENPVVQLLCLIMLMAIVRGYQDYLLLKIEERF